MKKLSFTFLSLLFTASISFSQEASYNLVKHAYESFDYEKVISLSDSLVQGHNLPDSLLINLNMMRAVSFYSKEDLTNVKTSFTTLLKINKNYSPDPLIYPPMIINIFNEVKTEYLNSLQTNVKNDIPKENVPVRVFDKNLLSSSAVRNLLIPGWGQLYSGDKIKGSILTVLSTAALGTMIYSIIDANKKENEYLNESNKNLIADKYHAYNSAYKMKYTFIFTYAALWVFSQLDLFFFSGEESFTKTVPASDINLSPLQYNKISLSFKIRF